MHSLFYLVLIKVYCGDHTYTTIRIAVAATGREVINAVADKLGSTDELLLVHLSSAGGKSTLCGSIRSKVSWRQSFPTLIVLTFTLKCQ